MSCGGLRRGTHLEGGTAVQLVAYGLLFGLREAGDKVGGEHRTHGEEGMHHCGALRDGVGLIAPASCSLQPLGGDASADEIADDGLSSLL